MCLAVPYTITELRGGEKSARAVSNGVGVEIRLDLIEEPAVNDVVLVHAGFAIQKLNQAEADELFALWEEANSPPALRALPPSPSATPPSEREAKDLCHHAVSKPPSRRGDSPRSGQGGVR